MSSLSALSLIEPTEASSGASSSRSNFVRRPQERNNPVPKVSRIKHFALPNGHYVPSLVSQRLLVLRVSLLVAGDLGPPIVEARFWESSLRTAMAMPIASMYEEHFATPRDRKVGLPGKVSLVQSVTVAHGMGETSNGDLRTGVLGSHRLHDAAALLRRACVGHPGLIHPAPRRSVPFIRVRALISGSGRAGHTSWPNARPAHRSHQNSLSRGRFCPIVCACCR